MLIFFLAGAASIARGSVEVFTPRDDEPARFKLLHTMTGMTLGCLGVMVGMLTFSVLLYLAHLYVVFHY